MPTVEIYIRFICIVFFVYGVIVTRAYLDTRKSLRYYKRHYDAQPRKFRSNYKPTAWQRITDYLITLSPIK